MGLVALLAAAAYTLWLNPEIRFYRHAAQVKRTWAHNLHRYHGSIYLVYGASSCAFAVDGERMIREHGLHVANFGMHAGMESLFLTALATGSTQPGDTLVVAIEPGLLVVPFDSPDLAAQMGMALGAPRLVHASDLTGERVHWVENILSLRPGAYHLFTLLGKIALRKPLYRYAPDDVRPSGWQQTHERRQIPDQGVSSSGALSPDAKRLLEALSRWGKTNKVQVVYSLPWGWVSGERMAKFQKMNARFLLEVAGFIPVLKDKSLGAYPVREHFADTEWHLTAEGAVVRTDSLARDLKAGEYWTIAELEELEKGL